MRCATVERSPKGPARTEGEGQMTDEQRRPDEDVEGHAKHGRAEDMSGDDVEGHKLRGI